MNVFRRHPVAAYLAIAYGLGILIYALPVLGSTGFRLLPIELPGVAPFILISTIMLTVVAFAVAAAAHGRPGVRDLRRRAFRFRVAPLWYLAAILLLPLSAFGVALAMGGAGPFTAIAGRPAVLADWIVTIGVTFVLINLWEEIGWTGFVLHRLQERVGPLLATVLTTWAQATLHLPLLFVIGGVSDTPIAPEQYPLYLGALYLLPLGNRTVLTWLYNRSGRSAPIAGLAHASFNLGNGSAFLPFLVAGLDGVWAYAGFAALGLALIVVTRGRLGYEAGASEQRSATAPGYGSEGVLAR